MTKRDDSLSKIENQVRFRTPASVNAAATNQVDSTPSRDEQVRVSRDRLPLRRSFESAKPFQNQGENKRLSTSSVHYGSYSKSVEQMSNSRQNSVHGFDSRSHSQVHLEHLLPNAEADLEHYGIHEFRDGFFDATFYRPQSRNREEMLYKAKETLPSELQTHHPLSWKHFLPRQWSGIRNIIRQITTTRSGIKLLRSFLSFFIAYITCLVPASRLWLGRYNYILVISSLFNHAGRPIGSQIDGTILTIFGTVAGLAWGSLALYVSTSTTVAQEGYGGVLATFLVLFAALLASLRCTFIRLYQAVIAAGVSICYTCLADTSESVGWKKIFNYGIPWVFGQLISLVVSFVVFPASGSRELT